MPNPFVNRRNIRSRRRGDSPIINTVQGEFIRIADFDTFYWHTPSPGVGADRWNNIPNSSPNSFSPDSSSQLVVGAMNPWNHADASNYPQSGGMLGSVIPPRTPTRSVVGFDLTGVPTAGSIVEATLSLAVADSQFWTRYEGSGPIQLEGFDRSLNYEVWAASWNSGPSLFPLPSPAEGLPAIVPSVNLYAQYAQFRNPNNPSVVPLLSQAVEDLSKIPAGRRVVMPHFWLDDAMSRQILKHEYYKPTADGTDYVGPAGTARFLSPWQETSTEDGRRTFSEFLSALSASGGMFDYICDDFENYGSFGLGSYFTAGGSNREYEPVGDARRTAAVVGDPRFNGYISRTSGKSFKDEFMENYSLFVPNASSDYTQILAPFTNVASATDFKAPWAIGQSPVMWAWQGALYSLMFGDLYLKRIVDPVRQLPQYSNVRIFNYGVYAKRTGDDVLSDSDLNTHLSHHSFVPDVNFSPVLYGEVSDSLMNRGYNPNLSPGDIARTRWGGGTRVGGGSNQGKAFVAFVKDTQTMRVAARGVPEGEDIQIAPWISTPSALYQSSYIHDPRYWTEMFFHACLCGAQFFNVFVSTFGEYDGRFNIIQSRLDEWKENSGNSKARLSTDNLVDIVDAVTNCLITGGMLLSGSNAGAYLWRISVPFDIVDGGGSTYLVRNGDRTDIPQALEIGSAERGTWLLTTTSEPPSYTATSIRPQILQNMGA